MSAYNAVDALTEELSERRKTILGRIAEEYLRHARPIGSEILRERFVLSWSAATIRNEMAYLEKQAFLTHCHTSSGRIPTAKGLRYFVECILEPEELSAQLKAKIAGVCDSSPNDVVRLLRYVSQTLSRFSENVSLVLMEVGRRKDYLIAGKENFLGQPEFQDSLKLKDLLRLLEEEELQEFIFRRSLTQAPIWISIGVTDLSQPYRELFDDLGIVSSPFRLPDRTLGSVSVVGPKRMNYRRTIPLVSYMARQLSLT